MIPTLPPRELFQSPGCPTCPATTKQDACSLRLVAGVGYCFLIFHIPWLDCLKDSKTFGTPWVSITDIMTHLLLTTLCLFEILMPLIKTLGCSVSLKDDFRSPSLSARSACQPHPPPGLTSPWPSSTNQRAHTGLLALP